MTQELFIRMIYGIAIIIVLYLIVQQMYSVYYTPGVITVYNSPIVQKLFPSIPNKMPPTWGYNQLGFMKADPTKYGQGEFWLSSGKGYKPNKSGSGGPSPSGGERNASIFSAGHPSEIEVGWWNGEIEQPVRTIDAIYEEQDAIPEKTVWTVGHWSNIV